MAKKKTIIFLVAVILIVVLSVAIWEFFLREAFSSDESTEYSISISYYGTERRKIRMSELQGLPEVSYEDVLGSGAIDNGPLVRDVILLRVNPSELSNDTMILIRSSLTLQERTLNWEELRNESKSYIFDFTKRGTVKFTSPDTPKNQRVKDVTYIEVGV
ncbi:MAG: hypothetical protein ACE5QW_03740 [Thermoplasmata archaeon]